MDDSLSAGAEERTRAALQELADRFKTRIRYAGRKEKSRFAAALAAESAVPREIVDFALFGDASCERSTGANRNCLLLDTAGSLLLSVDDDTLCQIAGAPERETELSFFSGYDPTELWFFPDRAHAPFNPSRSSTSMFSASTKRRSGAMLQASAALRRNPAA